MTNKMFIHYDDQGNIDSFTHEHAMFFEQRKAAGENIIEVERKFDYKSFKVDLTTLTIVPKTPEEIAAAQPKPIAIPIVIQPVAPTTSPETPIPSGS